MKVLLSILCLLTLLLSLTVAEGGVMVCYFGSWSIYRSSNGRFEVNDIDPNICTHLIYAFAGLGDDNKIKVLDPWNDLCESGNCAFKHFNNLKSNNTELKTLLAVGGWNEGSIKYSNMAKDAQKRTIFIESTIELLKTHGFDGLDLDWEYPTQRGGDTVNDKKNFIYLLKELSEALKAEGMMLAAAVSAAKQTIDSAYDISAMNEYLDLVNLMTYDLHGSWESYTHHHSGLYPHPLDQNYALYLNQNYSVSYWVSQGMSKHKIALGIPLYGRCWTLQNVSNTDYYAPATGPGTSGPYTRQSGFLGYNEICEKIQDEMWTVVYNYNTSEPYVYSAEHNKIWCSYEDEISVKIKAMYAKDNGLAGMMVWSIDMDDFSAKCGRSFNLIKTMVETWNGPHIETLNCSTGTN